jgi:hypothetical protein
MARSITCGSAASCAMLPSQPRGSGIAPHAKRYAIVIFRLGIICQSVLLIAEPLWPLSGLLNRSLQEQSDHRPAPLTAGASGQPGLLVLHDCLLDLNWTRHS